MGYQQEAVFSNAEEETEAFVLSAPAARVAGRSLAVRTVSCLGVVCALAVAGSYFSRAAFSLSSRGALASVVSDAETVFKVSNAYEHQTGRRIGDGMYPYSYLAEAHQATYFEVVGASVDASCVWSWAFLGVTAESSSCSGEVEQTFTSVGEYVTSLALIATPGSASITHSFVLHVKYVRRELRELTIEDRTAYFGALQVIYSATQDEGTVLYGPYFRSSSWLVREHLYGAASKMCDHWHDDAGFLNHHVGITWQFEQSLQAVDSTTAAHYWDYTIEAADSTEFAKSIIFSEDWFSSASPANARHAVDGGRFAYTAVKSDAREFSAITNPYGLLRSPWNTNSAPFLTRFSKVLGYTYDGYSLATCDDFANVLSETDTLATYLSKLNGELHGPIHIMIGGHWWFANNTANATLAQNTAELMGQPSAPDVTDAASWLGSSTGARSRALLASKFLWRQGYIRCPETCSADADAWSDCACTCPASIVGTTADEAYAVLVSSGLLDINSNWINTALYGMDWKAVLDFLCHVGHPGEMFTSAAPQDPTFWPLHGNAERFMHLVRLLAYQGIKPLDETWSYSHVTNGLDSDTHAVCDWEGVTGMEMPTCDLGATCPGHHADDLLPFILHEGQEREFTNLEFFDYTSPLNTAVPYVYDRITYWPACTDQAIY